MKGCFHQGSSLKYLQSAVGVGTFWGSFSHQSPLAWQAGSELHCSRLANMETRVPVADRDLQQSPHSNKGLCAPQLPVLPVISQPQWWALQINVLLFSHYIPSPRASLSLASVMTSCRASGFSLAALNWSRTSYFSHALPFPWLVNSPMSLIKLCWA